MVSLSSARGLRRIVAVLTLFCSIAPGAAFGADATPAPPLSQITVQPNVTAIEEVSEAAFSPDGTLLAINERSRIKLWQIATRRPLRTFENAAYFGHFVFIGGGAEILSVHKDGFIRVWNTATGMLVHEDHIEGFQDGTEIASLRYDAKQNVVAIAERFDRVMLWDAGRRQALYQTSIKQENGDSQPIDDANLSADGSHLIILNEDIVRTVDLATHAIREQPMPHTEGGQILAGARRIVGAAGSPGCSAALHSIDYQTQAVPLTIHPPVGCRKDPNGETDYAFGESSIFADGGGANIVFAQGGVDGINVVDLVGQQPKRTIPWSSKAHAKLIAADLPLGLAASLDGGEITIISLRDGRILATVRGFGPSSELTFAATDGQSLLLSPNDDKRHSLLSWPTTGVTPSIANLPGLAGYHIIDLAAAPNLALASDWKTEFVLYDVALNKILAKFKLAKMKRLSDAHLSPDGTRVLLTGDTSDGDDVEESALLLDSRSGRILKTIRTHAAPRKPLQADAMGGMTASAFSADGQRFAIGFRDGVVEVWTTKTPALAQRCDPGDDQTTSLLFSRNGRLLVGGSRDSGIYVWDLVTGTLLRTLERDTVAGHVNTASLAVSSDGTMVAAGPGQRAISSGDVGAERRIQVWDVATGQRRFFLSGHESDVTTILFSDDQRWIISGGIDGTIRYWDRESGDLAATFAVAADGRWAVITDKGFFAASAADTSELLSVVRGVQATSIDQMWQSLYAPDLVRERLRGDANGEYKTAAANAELSTVLDSGPAPSVTIETPAFGAAAPTDLITMNARIEDAGKGIGRIEWRVNGITVAVGQKPAGAPSDYMSRQQVALDVGGNDIEVVAYNASNLLASVPAHRAVTFTGSQTAAKPRLHVLAIGINAYTDQGSVTPSTGRRVQFKPLKLAVDDAVAVAEDFKRASAGLYADEADIVVLRDSEATRAGITAAIDRMAKDISPRDTFIFFAAAHGTTKAGRFYLIPQDYDGGIHPVWLEQRAIGQATLQEWFANKIKAKKALVLLDTCESGALISGYLRPRSEDSASQAGIGRLHEATGRPVLTAAASGQFAYEGIVGQKGQRHGVFTWALIEALHHAGANARDEIQLSSLVSYVQDAVPKLAATRGGVAEGRAATGDREEKVLDRASQSARFGSSGEDFVIAKHLP